MNRKAQVESTANLFKLVVTTCVGFSGVIISVLIGINCATYYNMTILPSFIIGFIPLVAHFQKQKNTSKLFYFMMWVVHFFCFVFQCVWDQSYNNYFNGEKIEQNFYCPKSSKTQNSDYSIKIGIGNYYLLMLSITFFHLLECILHTRKIYELADSKKSI
ncbi:hypothetical protein ABPG72_006924 [Tetrahymena utriculariae]